MVFSTVGLIVLAYPFSAIFGGGVGEVRALGNVVIAYLIGLILFTILFVLQRVFYALDDTRTPFFIQVFQSALFVVGVLWVATLPSEWIGVGIASVMTITGTAQTVLAAILVRRRLSGPWPAGLARHVAWFIGAALVAGGVGAVLVWALGGFSAGGFAIDTRIGAVVTLVVAGSVMAGVYAGILAVAKNEALSALVGPAIARLRSRR
jgi:putative peptidoglycan lipid II flippase